MPRMRDRPMSDIIVGSLTLVVAFVILMFTVAVLIALTFGHSPDVQGLARAVGELTSSLIALIVGYVAGRGVNGNGNGNGDGPKGGNGAHLP